MTRCREELDFLTRFTMERILDIHTHRPAPQPEALVCVSPADFNPEERQFYSVGIHPWETHSGISGETWELFEKVCTHPQVLAIGECGIDKMKGGPLFLQMQAMKRQIDLSERLRKPLVIHNVHAQDIIIGLKKDLKPKQHWMVHGFRGKPTVAKIITDAGIWLSFGPMFNDTSVPAVPEGLILAETDDSTEGIESVITKLSALRGKNLTETIALNSSVFLTPAD